MTQSSSRSQKEQSWGLKPCLCYVKIHALPLHPLGLAWFGGPSQKPNTSALSLGGFQALILGGKRSPASRHPMCQATWAGLHWGALGRPKATLLAQGPPASVTRPRLCRG